MNAHDEAAYLRLSSSEARERLWKHMAELGLRREDGWLIYEFTRQVDSRTELVARPIHPDLPAPTDLECACIIDEAKGDIAAECRT